MNPAAGFLLNIAVPNTHPASRIIGVVTLPDKMREGLEARQRGLASQSRPMRQTIDTAQVKVEYTIRGQMMEEQMSVVLTCLESHLPAYPLMHRPARTVRHCMTHGTYFKRAAKGHLDHLLANAIKPAQIDHEWDAAISRKMQAALADYKEKSDKQFADIQEHFKQQTAAMLTREQVQQLVPPPIALSSVAPCPDLAVHPKARATDLAITTKESSRKTVHLSQELPSRMNAFSFGQ